MKPTKLLAVCLLLMILPLLGIAQLTHPVQKAICSARLSPFVGMGVSNTSNQDDDVFEYSSVASPTVGAKVHISIGRGLSFIPGVAYETKGSTSSYSYQDDVRTAFGGRRKRRTATSQALALSNSDGFKTKAVRSYVSLPWQLGIQPFENLPDLQFNLGMNNSFLVGQKTTRNNFGAETTVKGTDNLKNFNLGVLLGASYQVFNGISVGASYDHGLTNMSTIDGLEIKERALRVMLAYTINFNPIFWESYSRRGRVRMKQYQTNESN